MRERDGQGEPVMVTRTSLPPIDEYLGYLREIWQSHCVTNDGPLVRQLEDRLQRFLGVPDVCYTNNGTTALQIAVKALRLSGEVITTPFSYVATAGVLLWEGCTPVFVDVRPRDLTIDPILVAAAVTPKTSAILATHIYGFPCDVDALHDVARRHGLKVVYDAAHAFGCRLNGRALASYGDASCLSFHATKVFHTVEGGAVVANGSETTGRSVRLMRAFGHEGDEHYCVGINGKNSELHAAMGLCNLSGLEATLGTRKRLHDRYTGLLGNGVLEVPVPQASRFEYNHAYFPVLLPDEDTLLRAREALARINVFPRRYFYPALSRIPYFDGASCPIAESAASRVLCLPMSELVTPSLQQEIVETLLAGCAR
jgi:dTDP-4-amino-4,6-dideoxygalactose transaminase